MYRVMMMVMLKDMWRYMKKEKFALLWYMLMRSHCFSKYGGAFRYGCKTND